MPEWLNAASALWGLFGGLAGWIFRSGADLWERRRALALLRRAAERGEVALCVGIGGQSAPEPDVRHYLQQNHPQVKTLLVYQTPNGVALNHPAVAMRIVDDLRDLVASYAEGRLTRVHFFPAGMIAYPFLVGAMLSNLCAVVVYHREKSGSYVPLYEWNRDRFQGSRRRTRRLSRWKSVDLDAALPSSAPTAGQVKTP